MLTKPPDCRGCPLDRVGTGFTRPDGSGSSGLMAVGMAPAKWEVRKGLPFLGLSGQLLDKGLSLARIVRRDLSIWNVLGCRPPGDVVEAWPRAIEHCDVHFKRVLQQFRPKAILTLGVDPMRKILNNYGNIVTGSAPQRGYVFDHTFHDIDLSVRVVPTIHPNYLIQGNMHMLPVLMLDARRAKRAVEGPVAYHPRYIQNPGFDDLDNFHREASLACSRDGVWFTADIETEHSPGTPEDDFDEIIDSEILRISFSYEGGHALTVPWRESYLPWIQKMLLIPSQYIVFWNAPFDVPRLLAKGLRIKAEVMDAMWMWHYFKTRLPKTLGFVATFFTDLQEWKSLSNERPEFYSCVDSDAAIQCTYGIRQALQREGRWDSYLSQVHKIIPILDYIGRGEHSGIKVDLKAQAEFRKVMQSQMDEALQMCRDGVSDEALKSTKSYERPPIEFRCPDCKGNGEIKKIRSRNKVKYEEIKPCLGCDQLGYLPDLIPESKTLGGKEGHYRLGKDGKWKWVQEFSPTSGLHVIRFIESIGDPVPKHHKTKEFTTGKGEIERLYKKRMHQTSKRSRAITAVYKGILDYREAAKMVTTYVDKFPIDPDGKVRTTFNLKPATLRAASQNPNVQNIRSPDRWPPAKAYRRQFVPMDGCALVGIDYDAIEAVLTGVYAEDPDYVRLAKLSIHGVLATNILETQGHMQAVQPSWSDADILEAVREVKLNFKDTYKTAKVIVHGSNYNPDPTYKMKQEYPDIFPTMKSIQELVDIYFGTLGRKIQAWQRKLLLHLYQHKYVDNVYGGRFWFWDVLDFQKKNKKEFTYGSQAKKALSALPQSTAAGRIFHAMRVINDNAFYRKTLRWQIHDELLFELPIKGLLPRIQKLRSIMEEPCPKLGGLSIGTSVKYSTKSWGDMEDL